MGNFPYPVFQITGSFIFFFNYLFMYLCWLCWALIAARVFLWLQ